VFRKSPSSVAALVALIAVGLLATACQPTTTTKATTATTTTTTTATTVTTPPASINATCATDVTIPLAKWLYSLPSGMPTAPRVVNFGTGCYLVNGSLFLRGFRYFTFEGGTFKQTTPLVGESYPPLINGPAYCGRNNVFTQASGTDFLSYTKDPVVIPFFFEGGCDITVSGMHFVGPDTTGTGGGEAEQDTFLTFAGTQTAFVDDVTIRGPFGDCLDAQALHEAPGPVEGSYEATNITLTDSRCSDAGRDDIGIVLASRIDIVHDRFSSAADSVFDVEFDATGGVQADIDIADNVIVGQHYAYLLSAQTGAAVERLQFSGNAMIDGAQMRVVIADGLPGDNVRVDYNRASGVSTAAGETWPAVRIVGIDGDTVAVDHNTVPLNRAGLAVVPSGGIVCDQDCPIIHIVGPTPALLP
jgi:hypothetical protein